MITDYQAFIESKRLADVPTGFEPGQIPDCLFDFQKDIVRWSIRRGRAAIFADCGLGKSAMQLAYSQAVAEHTNGMVLILAPIGVTHQTVREGAKFGIGVSLATKQDDCAAPGIYITNYEKLHRFDVSKFVCVVLDESSVLKSYDGATRTAIIESARTLPYRLACTATPAPNDYLELGNHAEFLGVMSRVEMLATFFVHDGGDTSKWRLKGHAENDFWRWLCSWAVNIRKPSDLGYDDAGFKLPPLHMHEHIVQSKQPMDGYLFALPASTLQERRNARRASLNERVEMAASLVNDERWVMWCDLNAESDALTKELNAAEIRGSTSEDEREEIISGFLDGSIKRVVTKGALWGFGLNLQCCHNTALVGISDSYETMYQILRRFWRYGQTKPVNAHIITSDTEGAVLANIKRKEAAAERMAQEMVRQMSSISSANIRGAARETEVYNPKEEILMPAFL